VRRWRELVKDRKNGRILFHRPKPTVGCSANEGRRRRGGIIGRRGGVHGLISTPKNTELLMSVYRNVFRKQKYVHENELRAI